MYGGDFTRKWRRGNSALKRTSRGVTSKAAAGNVSTSSDLTALVGVDDKTRVSETVPETDRGRGFGNDAAFDKMAIAQFQAMRRAFVRQFCFEGGFVGKFFRAEWTHDIHGFRGDNRGLFLNRSREAEFVSWSVTIGD